MPFISQSTNQNEERVKDLQQKVDSLLLKKKKCGEKSDEKAESVLSWRLVGRLLVQNQFSQILFKYNRTDCFASFVTFSTFHVTDVVPKLKLPIPDDFKWKDDLHLINLQIEPADDKITSLLNAVCSLCFDKNLYL